MRTIGLLLLAVVPVSPLAFSQAAHSSLDTSFYNSDHHPRQLRGRAPGPSKFQPRDRLVNGSPLYAQPAFDDAHWAPMDLTSDAAVLDLMLGASGYTCRWTRRGYPRPDGYTSYRLRLRLKDPDASPSGSRVPSEL